MLDEILGHAVNVDPNKTAVIFNDRRLTYAQLEARVQLTANWLDQELAESGSKVAIIAKNSVNYFILYLAVRRTNNIAVLINPKLPLALQNKMIADSRSALVYRDEDLVNLPTEVTFSAQRCDPDQPGLFLYTSGTTGEPRAAVVLNRQRQALVRRLYKLDPGVHVNHRIAVSPFYHMNGLSTIENILAAGGTAVIMPEFNAGEFLKLVSEYRVARLTIVPSMIAMCLDEPSIIDYNFDHVKAIVLATSPVTRSLHDRVKAVFKECKVRVRYGLTEIGPVFGPAPPHLNEPELTCGYPIDSVEYKLVNGVLHLRAPSMSLEYHNNSSTKIVDGWLNTGDLFRVDQYGFYYFMGRADDMYKVGGEQVYPQEIESALENVRGVGQAVVVMLEDDVKGHKPYAFCTGEFDESRVMTALLNTLPRYKIPRKIWSIDAIPVFGVGKVDRKLLTERARQLL
jgi:long-chain acyl-CoA synthetase